MKRLPYSEIITGGAASPNEKIAVSEADAIAAWKLSKFQSIKLAKNFTIADPNL